MQPSDSPRASAACPKHTNVLLLEQRRVDALLTVFGWDDAVVEHACEREFAAKRPGEEVMWSE